MTDIIPVKSCGFTGAFCDCTDQLILPVVHDFPLVITAISNFAVNIGSFEKFQVLATLLAFAGFVS